MKKWNILKKSPWKSTWKNEVYIQNSNKSENKVLKIANEIEEITIKIFDSLNDFIFGFK